MINQEKVNIIIKLKNTLKYMFKIQLYPCLKLK